MDATPSPRSRPSRATGRRPRAVAEAGLRGSASPGRKAGRRYGNTSRHVPARQLQSGRWRRAGPQPASGPAVKSGHR
ncbi:hypothetical protein SADUNF_Sadunf19G0059800 [Salix dunnii]|uniref:Uncharacterized protein n=1 Tax=Salix dunnii TaxID=1413687 RepID=A0A835MCH8_9ROSI|nr:hypothetical protein SADUNF_Sadunf19G0059800 [Salix dunnii]